jgi:peptidyl-prolyl cis-trans isomerase A (cyclophilin A)
MARSGDANDAGSKDTATSQFFINLKDNPSLDQVTYPYVVFGHVTEGKSVVDTIGAIPSNPAGDGEPTSPVSILRVTIV